MWFFNKDKDKESTPPTVQSNSNTVSPPTKPSLPNIQQAGTPQAPTTPKPQPALQKLKQTGSIPKALLDQRLKQTGGISKSALSIPKELLESYSKPPAIEKMPTPETKPEVKPVTIPSTSHAPKTGINKQLQQTMAVSKAALAAKLKSNVDAIRTDIKPPIPGAKESIKPSIPAPTPKAAKPKAKMFFCPICEEKMEKKNYGTAEVYSCDVCGGYWCPNNTLQTLASSPQAELSRILAVKLKALLAIKLEGELEIIAPHQCPSCKQNLLIRHYKKVIGVGMESCRQHCGTFIEKNVIEKIQILNRLAS